MWYCIILERDLNLGLSEMSLLLEFGNVAVTARPFIFHFDRSKCSERHQNKQTNIDQNESLPRLAHAWFQVSVPNRLGEVLNLNFKVSDVYTLIVYDPAVVA